MGGAAGAVFLAFIALLSPLTYAPKRPQGFTPMQMTLTKTNLTPKIRTYSANAFTIG
jgi:hypothetical protein